MPRTILVIDDDSEMRNLMRRVVEGAGHVCLAAGSGMTGLRLYEQHHPDLVITDIFMPDMDGLELVRQLRAIRARTPILAISGGGSRGDMEYLQMAKLLGANSCLRKPFRSQELIQAIDAALDGHPCATGSF